MKIYLYISNVDNLPTIFRGKMSQKKYLKALEVANIVLKNENRRLVSLLQSKQNMFNTSKTERK